MAGMQGTKSEPHDLREAEALRVTGRVKQPLVLSARELREMETEEAKDLLVICGTGTPRGRIASCRGVLLETVIGKADVLKEEKNDTKKMFIAASAGDGYKVVFSWQEIFNTPVGGGVMILVEKDGRSLCEEHGRLELISTEDYFIGSRHVKGLVNLEVLLAE